MRPRLSPRKNRICVRILGFMQISFNEAEAFASEKRVNLLRDRKKPHALQ